LNKKFFLFLEESI